jgi:hypothetical protein
MVLRNKFFDKKEENQKFTLADDRTKLYIKAGNEFYLIKVDDGIIQNIEENIKKCDYMIYDECNLESHMIELKGTNIDAAFTQIEETVIRLSKMDDYSDMVNTVNTLDAFIVSPNGHKFPRGVETKERKLTQVLGRKCKSKPKNILQLLKYVKVVPRAKLSVKDREIICSGDSPMSIPLHK